MAINYRIRQRKDPRNPEAAGKFYAEAITISTVREKQIAEEISKSCTVKYADIVAVLYGIQYEIIRQLKMGNTVQFGDIGSFGGVLHGLGSEYPEDYKTEFITRYQVKFREGKELTFKIGIDDDVKLKKISFTTPNGEEEEGGGI